MKPQNHKLVFLLICTYCLIFITGCGYTNPYTVTNDLDKNGEGHVILYLNMWENKTDLLGFQATIQHDIILWLKKSNRFHITQNIDEADYSLSGVIHAINQPALTYGEFNRATVLRAEVEFEYTLTDLETGKIVFNQARLLKREDYSVGSDAVRTNSNLQHALTLMSAELADNIYIQLFYLFTLDNSKGNRIIIPTDDIKALD